jgi:formate-dependent nitrite reductase cytochrome c552 subunit
MTKPKPRAWCCMLCHEGDVPHRRRDICVDCDAYNAVRGLAWCAPGKHRVRQTDMANRYQCGACETERTRRRERDTRAQAKAWRERNPDRVQSYFKRPDVLARRAEQRRAHYAAHPELYRATRRRRYHADPERFKSKQAAYRAANRSRELERTRQWKARRKLQILRGWRRAA